MQNETIGLWESVMKDHIVLTEGTELLTDALFSLEEPWRGRFLNLVANQATGRAWDERVPTRKEVATWLGDGDLYQEIKLLLHVWQGAQS